MLKQLLEELEFLCKVLIDNGVTKERIKSLLLIYPAYVLAVEAHFQWQNYRQRAALRRELASQIQFVEILHNKGYQAISKGGVCNGMQRTQLFSYLSGHQNLFNETAAKLLHLVKTDPEGLVKPDKAFTQANVNALALCDHIAFNQVPNLYQAFYKDERVVNNDMNELEDMQESATLFELENTRETRKGVATLHVCTRLYNQAQWLEMLETLDKACQNIKNTDAPVAVSFYGQNHVSGIFYSVEKRGWYFPEDNLMRNAFKDVMSARDVASTSWKIFTTIARKDNNIVTISLSTLAYTTTHYENQLKPLLNDWCAQQDKAVAALDALTINRLSATLYNDLVLTTYRASFKDFTAFNRFSSIRPLPPKNEINTSTTQANRI